MTDKEKLLEDNIKHPSHIGAISLCLIPRFVLKGAPPGLILPGFKKFKFYPKLFGGEKS